MKDLPPPSLDLFDLDEQFASEKIRLAQLANKCTDEDIDYYIKECGDILGVSQHASNPDDPKAILHYVFQEIFKYKSSSISWTGSPRGHGGVVGNAGAGFNNFNGNGDNGDACSNQAFHKQTENSYTDL